MKFVEKMENVLMPIAKVVSENKYLIAIRDGFLVTMPLLIIGSFFMLISNFPIQAWMDLMSSITVAGTSLSAIFGVASTATFSIMAIFAVMGIGYNFSRNIGVNPLHGAAISMVAWFMLMPMYTMYTPAGAAEAVKVSSVPFDWIGTKGLFIGIISVFLSLNIYKKIEDKGWVITMPAGVPPTVGQSFSTLIPAAIVMIVFMVIHVVFLFTPWGNAFEFVFRFLQLPLQNVGDSVGAMLAVYLFAHILWGFGIHGTNITDTVVVPILYALSAENLAALQAGQALPHVINKQFMDLFATYGGGGSTLSLLIAALLFCKSERIKGLSKLSILPACFGINEPVIFGLPIVLNPTILVPFIFVPLFNIAVTYLVMSIGLVPICNGIFMPWTTPPVVSGFLSSGVMGAIFQVIMIAVGTLIYMPFIKSVDNQYLSEEKESAGEAGGTSLDDLSAEDL